MLLTPGSFCPWRRSGPRSCLRRSRRRVRTAAPSPRPPRPGHVTPPGGAARLLHSRPGEWKSTSRARGAGARRGAEKYRQPSCREQRWSRRGAPPAEARAPGPRGLAEPVRSSPSPGLRVRGRGAASSAAHRHAGHTARPGTGVHAAQVPASAAVAPPKPSFPARRPQTEQRPCGTQRTRGGGKWRGRERPAGPRRARGGLVYTRTPAPSGARVHRHLAGVASASPNGPSYARKRN